MIDIYFLDNDIVKLCGTFADRVISTNMDEYSKRKQSNTDKVWRDIFFGKLAEWGVYFIYLERNRKNISVPDMNIYPKQHKSFDADLRWGLYQLHVKSQTLGSVSTYGDSWLFQSKDPLFEHCGEYDILIGCTVDLHSSGKFFVQIKLEKPIKNLKFAETKLQKFSTNKKAVYLKDNNE